MPATTLLDSLITSLHQASAYNRHDQMPPAAVLWPDKERQWEALLPLLRTHLTILTLGDYQPEIRQGPAYYLRCMLAGTLEDRLPDGAVPILYLPGYSRQDIRAVEDCPKPLRPLAELQYRGVLWTHKNGRDWTVPGFLQSSDGGLDIPVQGDTASKEALLRALPRLVHEPVARLRSQAPLRAAFFDELLNPDEVRRLLKWMDDPQGWRDQMAEAEWRAFVSLCRNKYGLDPEKESNLSAAERLGNPSGVWQVVWQRYSEVPEAYPAIPELLRRAAPSQPNLLGENASPYYPQDNENAEAELRDALLALEKSTSSQARQALLKMEERHGHRRQWVWAKLGQAPLALALVHLLELADGSSQPLAGGTVQEIAAQYAEGGWQVDGAVLAALAAVQNNGDVAAVKAAVLTLYRHWLTAAATALQQTIAVHPAETYKASPPVSAGPGEVLLFSDALRYDLAHRLAGLLTAQGFVCDLDWRLTALPPVTATAKAAVAPVAAGLVGNDGHNLAPASKASGTTVSIAVLQGLLDGAGYQVLKGDDLGDPGHLAWTEQGAIDSYGHNNGWKVAIHALAEVQSLAERIAALLAHGWTEVQVITDHGWLLLPGGLPKAELPVHLAHLRKGRCAVLKAGAATDQQTVPWHWNPDVAIAIAPGIACFEAGKEYEHGGVSPQECVVPHLRVRPAGASGVPLAFGPIIWRGLRCTCTVAGAPPEATVDLRRQSGVPASSLTSGAKALEADGVASLLVVEDDAIGAEAMLVVLAADGSVLLQTRVVVGG
ncbi:MAG: BREX-1 system phosphatase PglZ type B [Caldilineaceae bacterium]|nr:BREX-1 system phosphatase PglZ type B [Caldilineaceae bacterium]